LIQPVIKQIKGRELSMDDFKDRNVKLMRTVQYGDNTHEFFFPKSKPTKLNPDEWKRVDYEIYIDGYEQIIKIACLVQAFFV
jgi:hypothetical protein